MSTSSRASGSSEGSSIATFNRIWWPEKLPRQHLQHMTQEIIWQRNVAITVLASYSISRLIFGAALYPLRKTITVIILNAIYFIEGFLGLAGWMQSRPYLILGHLSSWGATVFMFLLYFLAYSLAKGDWMLWVVHGVPMIITLVCLGVTARYTMSYWKWLQSWGQQTLPTQHQATVLGSTNSNTLHVASAESGQCAQPEAPKINQAQPQVQPQTQGRPSVEPVDASDSDACPVCLAYRSNCCLVPCGHMVCMICGTKMFEGKKKCPVCRTKIAQIVRTYK